MAPDDDGEDMQPKGFTLPRSLVEELDERKRTRDARESHTVYRSEIAREAIELGLAAMDVLDEPEYRRLHMADRKALVRQAVLDHIREDD